MNRQYVYGGIVAIVTLMVSGPVWATKTVNSPYVSQGVATVAWKGGVTTDPENKAQEGAWKQKALIGYGLTDLVYIEAEGVMGRAGGRTPDVTGLELKAKVQLTTKDAYWLDSGFRLNYKLDINGGIDSVEAKLLLAKTTGAFAHRANIIFERQVGFRAGRDTSVGLSWSSRYDYKSYLQPGFELYSAFGTLRDRPNFERQSHQIGPVFYGKFGGGFNYEVGYLVGVTKAAPAGEAKAILGYEFKF
jgi:hypothetical protein